MRWWHRALLLAASVVFEVLSWRLPAGWVLGWVASTPALVIAASSRRRWVRVGWVFSAAFLASAGWFPVERGVIPMSMFVAVHLGSALLLGVSSAVVSRESPWSGWAAASLHTLLTALVVSFNPHGTWGLSVYSQTAVPVLQLLALGGPFLLLWLMDATAASLALVVVRRGAAVRPLATALGATVALVATGPGGPSGAEVKVGLFADDRLVPSFRTEQEVTALPVVERYAAAASALAKRGAQLVVLPEKLVGVTPAYEAKVDERLMRAAPEALVVAGLNANGREPRVNEARVLVGGAVLLTAVKRHLVPGWEDGYLPGDSPRVWGWGGVTFGVAVCKDFDFTSTSRTLGRAGAQVVVAPAWDFEGTEVIHARMARFRAVEGGFALVRVAQEGHLDVWDSRGRSIAHAVTGGSAAELLASVPAGASHTPYSGLGDWPLALCAVVVLASFLRRHSSLLPNASG